MAWGRSCTSCNRNYLILPNKEGLKVVPRYLIDVADVACMVREFLHMIFRLLIKNVTVHIMLNCFMK